MKFSEYMNLPIIQHCNSASLDLNVTVLRFLEICNNSLLIYDRLQEINLLHEGQSLDQSLILDYTKLVNPLIILEVLHLSDL